VQAWRTTEFPADSPDSRVEIMLAAVNGGTRLTLKHGDIPAGQGASYESGWVENYFEPMRVYFSED
jgi:activator of HSP90 ATPase